MNREKAITDLLITKLWEVHKNIHAESQDSTVYKLFLPINVYDKVDNNNYPFEVISRANEMDEWIICSYGDSFKGRICTALTEAMLIEALLEETLNKIEGEKK